MLLWLGRPEDKRRQQKESLIKALVEFDDRCGEWLSQAQVDKGFYEYRAYFLAAAGIAEFGDCSRADEIVKQIVQCFGAYFNEQAVIGKGAQEALQETERIKAIAALVQLLESTQDKWIRRRAAESLVKIWSPNNLAKVVAALKDSLNNSQRFNDKYYFNDMYYDVIWDCAQNMTYPAFYQAWHKNPLDTLTKFLKSLLTRLRKTLFG